jgi:AraC-like DNA-binding protein
MTQNDRYVTGIALSQFVYGAQSLGIDSLQIINQTGLSQEYLKPSARVPGHKYEMALLKLILAHKNVSFGVDIGQQIIPPLYGVLMSLALNSNSLGEALGYLARYQAIATGNCGEVEYSFDGENYLYVIAMTHQNRVIRRHVSECVMIMFCNLIRLIAGRQDLAPTELWFEHEPASKSAKMYIESIVKCPVFFNKDDTRMIISDKIHHFHILGHGEDMLRIAEKQADDQLKIINKKLSVIEKIKWHILELMQSSQPRRETVAKRLQISPRTLDRRLEHSDTSWQELIDELRLQLSVGYLLDSQYTINDVSQKLGFSEIRAFQRKFKSWTGLTPSEYRKSLFED